MANCIDQHRLINSGKSTFVILKTERSVLYRLCDCNPQSNFYTHNKKASLVTAKKYNGKYVVCVVNSTNKIA